MAKTCGIGGARVLVDDDAVDALEARRAGQLVVARQADADQDRRRRR